MSPLTFSTTGYTKNWTIQKIELNDSSTSFTIKMYCSETRNKHFQLTALLITKEQDISKPTEINNKQKNYVQTIESKVYKSTVFIEQFVWFFYNNYNYNVKSSICTYSWTKQMRKFANYEFVNETFQLDLFCFMQKAVLQKQNKTWEKTNS